LDNTHGYGPEHYYAIEGSTLPGVSSLYGAYQIRVQYYSDKSGAETPQIITWHLHVKYLAFKDTVSGREYWVEESRDGILGYTSSVDTDNFYNGDSSWSSTWNINYPAPNPSEYNIPAPPQNRFVFS
jgi:hypothetical protein